MLPTLLVLVFGFLYPVLTLADLDISQEVLGKGEIAFDLAPIIIDGRKVSDIRGIPAFPAKRRAREIAQRIQAFAENSALNPGDLRIVEEEKSTRIVGPSGDIVRLFDFDAAFEGAEMHRSVVADIALRKIREAILMYREDRRPEVLFKKVGQATGLTALTLVLFLVGRWGFHKLSIWIEQKIPERLDTVEVKSLSLIRAEQLWQILRGTLTLLAVVAAAVLAYLYLNAVLGLFPWTRLLATHLFDLLVDPLRTVGTAILNYLPNLVFLLIIVGILRYVLKLLHTLFGAINKKRITFSGFDAEWSWPTYRLVRLLVLALGLILAYPYIPGSESAAFKGVTIFLGVLASIGSSSIISNVVAGYSMTYRRVFKTGDRVRIGETIGDVIRMRLLVTHVRTIKNEEIIIPNSTILVSQVTNYSSLAGDSGLILHTTVGIGYEVPWRQVEAMLLMAARQTPGLITNRDPFVLKTALGDYAINYELNVFTDKAENMAALYNALHSHILDVFNEYGVAIMTPSYVSDPDDTKLVPREQWYAAPAAPPAGSKQP